MAKGYAGASGERLTRVSPLKPALRGARNWTVAQARAATYSRKAFWRLVAGLVALFAFVAFLGLWMGGVLPDVQRGIDDFKRGRLMAMGFEVRSVDVVGEGRLDEAAVRRALGTYPGDYFFELDMDAAQARVRSLPWVDHAVVRRLWPDRVVVQIVEKRPYALWQESGEFRLVDARGEVIAEDRAIDAYSELASLPHVVGPDAHTAYGMLDSQLELHPDLATRVTAAVRVGERWDLVMDAGQRVSLPVEPARALARLSDLHRRTRVLDRRVAVIDLRLPDRIGLVPEADTRS